MIRTYRIDGREVTVTWVHRQHPPVYTILIEGTPAPGSIQRTALGRFHAVDAQGRLLGTFAGLREAVERVIREEERRG